MLFRLPYYIDTDILREVLFSVFMLIGQRS